MQNVVGSALHRRLVNELLVDVLFQTFKRNSIWSGLQLRDHDFCYLTYSLDCLLIILRFFGLTLRERLTLREHDLELFRCTLAICTTCFLLLCLSNFNFWFFIPWWDWGRRWVATHVHCRRVDIIVRRLVRLHHRKFIQLFQGMRRCLGIKFKVNVRRLRLLFVWINA